MAHDTVYICFACDKNFIMPLSVTLVSLSVNLSRSRKAVIYILEGGISDLDRQALRKVVKYNNIEVRFLRILDQDALNGMPVSHHASLAVYYRLMIPELVSRSLSKIIYLDSDVIVNTDIGKLWDLDVGDKYLLAAQEQHPKALYVKEGLKNFEELGIRPTEKYFNSGVLVMNLARWREKDLGRKVFDYIRHHKEEIQWWDQDGLNAVLAYQWGELDPRWNLLSHVFNYRNWNDGPVKDRETYQELVRRPYIIHFNTSSKPWKRGCKHPFARLFLKHLRKTTYWPLALRLTYRMDLIRMKGIFREIFSGLRKKNQER